MRIVIRTDSSLKIGSGHLMRCLTLADELRQRGAEVTFVCREHPGNLISLVESKNYPVIRLPQPKMEYVVTSEDVAHAAWLGDSWQQDAAETIESIRDKRPDWLIIDHYAIDRRWEEMLRSFVGKIMVIDDLADRPHNCDLLLDQNLYLDMKARYEGLLSKHCRTLVGPYYVLLRPEFLAAKKNLRERDGIIKRILIFFGGSDPTNETAKTLEALRLLNRPEITVDVVVGGGNPHRDKVKALCEALPNMAYHCQVTDMAELILKADVGIGSGGSSMWERCCLGLPTITVIIADNQESTTRDVAAIGAIDYLGWSYRLKPEDYTRAIVRMSDNPQVVRKIGCAALKLLNLSGTPVSDIMLSIT